MERTKQKQVGEIPEEIYKKGGDSENFPSVKKTKPKDSLLIRARKLTPCFGDGSFITMYHY